MQNQTYEEFVAEWKPLIRPKGLGEALQETFRLGPMERNDISRLPRFFAEYDRLWLRELGTNLRRHPHVRSRLFGDDLLKMYTLLDKHRGIIRTGRFGEDYLDSIEDIGLFFLYHEIMPLWVISCYDQMKNRLLDAVQSKALHYCDNEQLALTKGISTVALVDCTQLHRVFNFYDHMLAEECELRRLAMTDYKTTDQKRRSGVA